MIRKSVFTAILLGTILLVALLLGARLPSAFLPVEDQGYAYVVAQLPYAASLERTDAVCKKIEELGIGKRKTNFRMRDAAFSRQRYWGEPFPIQWKEGTAVPLDESGLPLVLPYVAFPLAAITRSSPIASGAGL